MSRYKNTTVKVNDLELYKKLRKEMDYMKKDAVKKGIPLTWDNPGEKD